MNRRETVLPALKPKQEQLQVPGALGFLKILYIYTSVVDPNTVVLDHPDRGSDKKPDPDP